MPLVSSGGSLTYELESRLMSHHVELRSDTFTKPTPGMLEAMMNAEVGDDVVSEDRTVNRFEAMMAEMLGKDAAVFNSSGTQSNQMALWANCERGDEVLIESSGHIANYESGAPAVLSGVSIRRIDGDEGRLDLEHLEGQIKRDDDHYAPTKLLCLENSTNIGGGRTYSLEQLERVCGWAHNNSLRTHLDGARLFNACLAQGYSVKQVAEHFDTISICFSKGLGCPMGSVLVGSQELITRARRARKVMGGSLRQAGIIAAGMIYALENHVDRLTDDHKRAKHFANEIAKVPGISIDLETVETNLVFFTIDPTRMTGDELQHRLEEQGVKLYSVGPNRLRACFHLDLSDNDVGRAIEVIKVIVH